MEAIRPVCFCTQDCAAHKLCDKLVVLLQDAVANSIRAQLGQLHEDVAELKDWFRLWMQVSEDAEAQEDDISEIEVQASAEKSAQEDGQAQEQPQNSSSEHFLKCTPDAVDMPQSSQSHVSRAVVFNDAKQPRKMDSREPRKPRGCVEVVSDAPPQGLDELESQRASELFEAERKSWGHGDDGPVAKSFSNGSARVSFAKTFSNRSSRQRFGSAPASSSYQHGTNEADQSQLVKRTPTQRSQGSRDGEDLPPRTWGKSTKLSSVMPSGAPSSDNGPCSRTLREVNVGSVDEIAELPGIVQQSSDSQSIDNKVPTLLTQVDAASAKKRGMDARLRVRSHPGKATLQLSAGRHTESAEGQPSAARGDLKTRSPDLTGTTQIEGLQRSRALEICKTEEREMGNIVAEPCSEAGAVFLQRCCGVLPWFRPASDDHGKAALWAARCYRFILVGLASLSFAWSVGAALSSRRLSPQPRCDLAISLGSVLGLCCTGAVSRSSAVSDFLRFLTLTASRERFQKSWMQATCKDSVLTVLVWLGLILARFLSVEYQDFAQRGKLTWEMAIDLVSFSFATGILAGMGSCTLHISRGLALLVDSFCSECANSSARRMRSSVSRWNLTHAKLRYGCSCVQNCLFVLQASILAAGILAAVECVDSALAPGSSPALSLVPALILLLGLTAVLIAAARVTDKCVRASIFIGTLSFGLDIDMVRKYVVDHIVSSRAGFYMFEMRVTSAIVAKFSYVLCCVALSLGGRVLMR